MKTQVKKSSKTPPQKPLPKGKQPNDVRKKNVRREDIVDRKVKNFETTLVTEAFVLIFLLLIGYVIYFTVYESGRIIDNPYNKRIDALEKFVVRGDILAADNTVLATTVTGEDGKDMRYYPYGNVFAHAVGINNHGKLGIEALCNYSLLTSYDDELEQLAFNFTGEKSHGNNVKTTLDVEIQQAVSDIISKYTGAVVVMEADTGKILAMVSKPDFDPNESAKMYNSWAGLDNSQSVLLNRVTHGVYPPGSTFKLIMLSAYYNQKGTENVYTYDCKGVNYINGTYKLQCFDQRIHGVQDINRAFANSCNGAFAQMGQELDYDKLSDVCNRLLFNSNYGFELGNNISKFSADNNMTLAEKTAVAIGQGKTLITPLHNLIIAAAVANNGNAVKPYVVDEIIDADKNIVSKTQTTSLGQFFTGEEATLLKTGMEAVVREGTAEQLQSAVYPVYGKTGSAQFDNSSNHHSLFMGYATINDKNIAISVVIEGGREEFTVAADVARRVFDKCYIKFLQN